MKTIIGWAYKEDKFNKENINGYGYTPAWNIVVLSRKKDGGKHPLKKVKITIKELDD